MPRWHRRSYRKPTGGMLKSNLKRKSRQKGSQFVETRVGSRVARPRRMRGGGSKTKLLSVEQVVFTNPKNKKSKPQQARLVSVEENPANPHYVRRNVITRGALVKTDKGMVRITSRPGQTGSLSGVLVEEKG